MLWLVGVVGAIAAGLVGVHPSEVSKYTLTAPNSVFHCLHSGLGIPGTLINDDYCDCDDGSDEPSTAACDYQFYCSNEGSVAHFVRSNRVGDGVCDCCDGTDEPPPLCPDTCLELAARRAVEEAERLDIRIRGMATRREYIANGTAAIAELREAVERNKKLKLNASLATLRALDEKEKQEAIEQEEIEAIKMGYSYEDARGGGAMREAGLHLRVWNSIANFIHRHIKKFRSESYYSRQEANEARQVHKQSDEKVKKLESTIEEDTKRLGHDYGPQREYFVPSLECRELQTSDYKYRLCPFRHVVQVDGRGFEVRMGNYVGWRESAYGEYGGTHDRTVQRYEQGTACYAGPQRSVMVRLQCAAEEGISNVEEPSRCEYTLLWSTPAACKEETTES